MAPDSHAVRRDRWLLHILQDGTVEKPFLVDDVLLPIHQLVFEILGSRSNPHGVHRPHLFADQKFDRGLPWRRVGFIPQLLDVLVKQAITRVENALLVLEVMVEGAHRQPGCLANIVDGDIFVGAVREQLDGRLKDLPPGCIGLFLPVGLTFHFSTPDTR
jgi:hypothetical protein